ncbi:hypothetical protein [Alteribacter natronophilus]|uniref:hypothetical protein n=1 Tax=Alteribacter natronophilus TaxID=2583810 RepID=UPI00110E49ED|nr:hypothetical protein [Alteribacter natronophilus]TMW72995.1 hypothetical protein FGB90_01420 [Alteribacter natronophilus]
MYNVFQAGSLLIPYWMFYLAGSLAAGFLYLKFFSSYKESRWHHVRDKTADTVIIFVLVFQFGTAVLHLPMLLEDPLAVLSYPSGSAEFYTALLFTSAYVIYLHFRNISRLKHTLTGIFLVLVVSDFVFSFLAQRSGEEIGTPLQALSHHPVGLYTMLLCTLVLVLTSQNLLSIKHAFALWAFGKWLISRADPSNMFFHLYGMNYFLLVLLFAAIVLNAVYFGRNLLKKSR